MKKTRNKYRLFSYLKVVDEVQEEAVKNPTKENVELYGKMQDLFFKHVKDFAVSK